MQKKTLKTVALVLLALVIIGVAGLFAFSAYGHRQMQKIPGLSFEEALAYTLQDNADAVITVGVIRDGELSYTVYGEDARELPPTEHIYEIGSVTKTFTATLVAKAIGEGRIDHDATVARYLDLPEGKIYPTITELLTHTSGYKNYYFAPPMTGNFFAGRNSFYRVTREMVLERVGDLNLDAGPYPFRYSNFGYAVLGLVLEAVYDTDYTRLVNDLTRHELGLPETTISERDGDLDAYWHWAKDDGYLAAGALTTDISDMLNYARLQLAGRGFMGATQEPLKAIDGADEDLQMLGVRMDESGMAWMIDREQNIIWHNGATGDFNCYLGFDPDTQTAVVVLSNLSPNERIPATILGIKLLNELRGR